MLVLFSSDDTTEVSFLTSGEQYDGTLLIWQYYILSDGKKEGRKSGISDISGDLYV